MVGLCNMFHKAERSGQDTSELKSIAHILFSHPDKGKNPILSVLGWLLNTLFQLSYTPFLSVSLLQF